MKYGSFLALGAGLCRRGNIPCPPCFLLAVKMNVISGHKIHVFASHVHSYGSYPDGGTLGYYPSGTVPHPKPRKNLKYHDNLPFFMLGETLNGNCVFYHMVQFIFKHFVSFHNIH